MGKQKFSRGLKRSICIGYMQSGKSRKEKSWGQAVERLNGNTGYPITYCCELLDRSKQAYYKKRKRDEEYLLRVMRIVDVP